MKDFLYFDFETTGLSPFKNQIHGVGVALNDAAPAYYPAHQIPAWVKEAVASKDIIKVGSNIRGFDLRFAALQGWTVDGDSYDTALLSLILNDSERSHGLKQITERNFGKGQLGQKSELDTVLEKLGYKHVGLLCALDLTHGFPGPYFGLIGRYCCEDITNTRDNFKKLKAELEQLHAERKHLGPTQLDYLKTEVIPVEAILLKMETAGVRVDRSLLDEIRENAVSEQAEEIRRFEELCAPEISEINKILLKKELATVGPKGQANRIADPAKYGAVFSISSPAHLGQLVYRQLGCPAALVRKTKKGAYSTKEEDVQLIADSADEDSKLACALQIYLDVKKYNKLIGTYTGNEEKGVASLLQERNGMTLLYPEIKQRTTSGRTSTFPLNTLPKKTKNAKAAVAKKFFIPTHPDNCFVYSDLAGIEFRIACHLSGDEAMRRIIIEKLDPHTLLASRLFNKPEHDIKKDSQERDVAKTVRYLTQYGGGAKKLYQELTLKRRMGYSLPQCDRFIKALDELHYGYKTYCDSIKSFVEKHHYIAAENGRVRQLPDVQFGKFLDEESKIFFGPKDLFMRLLKHGGERPSQADLFYRAKGRYKHAINAALNHPNQSLAATVMKSALINMVNADLDVKTTVHDSCYVECKKSEAKKVAALVKHLMESSYKLSVPLESTTKILTTFSEDDELTYAQVPR